MIRKNFNINDANKTNLIDNNNNNNNNKNNKTYIYGDALGRFSGEGRFNNVNSIISNGHRIFYSDKNINNNFEKFTDNFPKTYNNVYSNNNNENKKFLSNSLNKIYNNNLHNNNNKINNIFTGSSLLSFNSLSNSYKIPIHQNSILDNNKNNIIEKIFYNYNKTLSPLKNNLHPVYEYYTLDNKNKYNPTSYKNNEINGLNYLNLNNNNNNSLKPELNLTKSDIIHPSYSYLKNDSNHFEPNKSYDFHNIYNLNENKFTPSVNLKPSLIHNNNINNNNNKNLEIYNKNLNSNNDLIYSINNKIYNTNLNDNIKIQNLNEFTVSNCTCVSEYSSKKYHNEKYNLQNNIYITCIDKFNSNNNKGLFCIFDGENGNEVSKYLSETISYIFERNLRMNPKNIQPFKNTTNNDEEEEETSAIKSIKTSVETILLKTFLKLDDDLKYMKCLNIGSSACVVYITNEKENVSGYNQIKKTLYVANVGNIQCLLISKLKSVKLTELHDLNKNINEKNRIQNNGGVIYHDKIYGQTNLSRNFGLHNLKPYGLTAVPEVNKIYLNGKEKFVVVGNSAVFESLSEGDIFNFCMKCEKTEEIAGNIVTNCIYRGTKKNIGVVVIKL